MPGRPDVFLSGDSLTEGEVITRILHNARASSGVTAAAH